MSSLRLLSSKKRSTGSFSRKLLERSKNSRLLSEEKVEEWSVRSWFLERSSCTRLLRLAKAPGSIILMPFLERLRVATLEGIWLEIKLNESRGSGLLQTVWVMLQLQIDGQLTNCLVRLKRVKRTAGTRGQK